MFDGHGEFGHSVSQAIKESFREQLMKDPRVLSAARSAAAVAGDEARYDWGGVEGAMQEALQDAESALVDSGEVDCSLSGCTAVACLVQGCRVVVMNVGDSRAVVCVAGLESQA